MLRDLSPRGDPKGGSPRTPTPIPIPTREIEISHQNGKSGVIISALIGALLGMTVAWWTALQSKGVSRQDMEEYVSKYSPYNMDKKGLDEHQSNQDKEIGILAGKVEGLSSRMDKVETMK